MDDKARAAARLGGRIRAGLIALVAVVLIGGVAGFALLVPRSSTGRSLATVRNAPDKLRAAHWFRLALQLQLIAPDGPVRTTTATAVVDADNDRAAVRIPDVLGRPDLQLVAQGPILYLSIPPDRRSTFPD